MDQKPVQELENYHSSLLHWASQLSSSTLETVELKGDQLCGSTPCHTAIHLGKVTYFSLSNTQSTWFQYNLYIKSN